MLSFANDAARRLRLPGYIVIGYMTIGSLLDVLISAQPATIHDLRWRLGVSTLLSGASGTELLGALLFLALAVLAADQVSLWVGFVLSLLIGLGYLAVSGVFSLDSLQMRGQIRPELLARYNLGLVWTLARLAFTGIVLFIVSGACLRAARTLGRATDRNGAKSATTPLVVGGPSGPGVIMPAARTAAEHPKAPTA